MRHIWACISMCFCAFSIAFIRKCLGGGGQWECRGVLCLELEGGSSSSKNYVYLSFADHLYIKQLDKVCFYSSAVVFIPNLYCSQNISYKILIETNSDSGRLWTILWPCPSQLMQH